MDEVEDRPDYEPPSLAEWSNGELRLELSNAHRKRVLHTSHRTQRTSAARGDRKRSDETAATAVEQEALQSMEELLLIKRRHGMK